MKKMRLILSWLLVFLFCGGSAAFAGGFPSLVPHKAQFKLSKPTVRPLSQTRAQLKLTFKQFNVKPSGQIDRSLGERVMALLEVENQGQTTESVRVHYMVGRNPTTASTGVLTLNPGQKLPAVITLTLPSSSRSSDHNIHFDQRSNSMWWAPAFAIRKVNGAPFTDANMTDNAVGPSNGFRIPIDPKIDLEVASIDAVRLTETWHGGGSLDEGTIHPVSLAATIKVKNNGSQNSRPMTMAVNLMSAKEAITSARSSRGAQYNRVGTCASWPLCSMSQELTIPAVPAGQTRSFPVHFAPIPHSIERAGHGVKMAGGPYACGRGGEVMASTAKISATIRTADEDVAFMHNNSLTKEGKFETTPFGPATVSCGFQ
ncbi:hypothetical protein [Geopsychrobacter electrodiphilus]|uniref:hypothetical protein n=1 Tax=Geopsychrobacter electrodiphilus TaxID=225196 RepID=UPI00036A64B1|nr:hypothetical protein [Geopsychrobacter electrodiphilus]